MRNQMQSLVTDRDHLDPALGHTVFSDRTAQFVDRFEWDLCVTPEGLETDEYDGAGSRYVIVCGDGEHLGSCRVRPVEDGTMLVEHFGEVFPAAAGFLARQAGRLYELTRFCRSPKISVGRSREMLRVLAEALDAFRDANGITGFVAVVYPPVARFLGRIGVRYLVLDVARMQGREVLLICITHAVEAQRLTLLRRLGMAGVVGDPGPEGPVRALGDSLRDGSPRSPS